MTVTINGTTGVSLCDTNSVPTAALQASAVTQPKVGSGVAGNGPAFSAYRSTNQSISASTWTKEACDTEEFDTNSNYDNATNYRFTPTVAGYYQFSFSVDASASASATSCQLQFYKNGSSYKRCNGGGGSGTSMSAIVYCNGSTDYVEAYAYVVAVSAALGSGLQNTWFQGALVRAA